MKNHPTVSVLMPVYNGQRYLAQAIESILVQTFIDFELIIIDDGSSDESIKILEKYKCQDERIKITTRENRGLTVTMNEMIDKACGKYIAVIEQDDIALPDRLKSQVEFLDKNPQVICLGGAVQIIDHKGRFLTTIRPPKNNDKIQALAVSGNCSMFNSMIMIRRKELIEIGGYNETMKLAHDIDLWLRLGEIGLLENLQTTLGKYRLHSNSVSVKYQEEQLKEANMAAERAWQRRGIKGNFEGKAWRPSSNPASKHKFMLQWGWWAFNSGERQTAIIYGLKSIQALPFKPEGWKLLACALVKKLPTLTLGNKTRELI